MSPNSMIHKNPYERGTTLQQNPHIADVGVPSGLKNRWLDLGCHVGADESSSWQLWLYFD